MDTITIQVEDKSMLSSLRKILNSMEGVKILKSSCKSKEKPMDITQTKGFLEAMEDKRLGRIYHTKGVDDMFKQILGDGIQS